MKELLRILHLEDSKIDAELIATKLQEDGLSSVIEWVETKDEFAARLGQGGYDVILADYTLPSFDGLSALRMARDLYPDVPFIFVSATIGEDRAVETFKSGATDYVLKGYLSRLVPSIRRALKDKEEREERRHAEQSLRESEKKYKNLFESTLDGIYQVDADGIFVTMNPAGARIFGYESPEEMIGRHALEYWRDPRDRDAFRAELKIKKSVSRYHMKARDKNGKPVELESTSIIREDANGNFQGIDGILRDITDRMRADERLSRHIQKLSALRSIDMAIGASLDIRMTLKVFLEQVVSQLNVDACDVLLLSPHAKTLDYAAGQGFRTDALRHTHLRLGQGYAGVAAFENRIVRIPDLKKGSDFKQGGALEGEDFIAYYGVPLVAKGHVKGVLEIFHRSPLEPDEEWREFLDALALQAAIAIDSNSLFQELERSNMGLVLAYDSTIEGWSRALDYRDKETEGHSQRVTEMTIKIAREMGIQEEQLMHVRWGALLHDIGKMGIPDSILLKPGPLTEEEWKIMRLHPVYAYELLQPIDYLRSALDIPYCHHEKWDGTGYSRGLKGEQIPLSARIFAVVDVWDALRSDRPYRPAWSREKTLDHIRQLAGTHFDPKVIEVFLNFNASGVI
jgi:PAS domain S-box-containing protein/putative nucleotidyltransferase with HDIG domain